MTSGEGEIKFLCQNRVRRTLEMLHNNYGHFKERTMLYLGAQRVAAQTKIILRFIRLNERLFIYIQSRVHNINNTYGQRHYNKALRVF